MSLGDAIRGLIDPLHPAVREWLQRELPRLVREGHLDEAQADLIARRYGVKFDAAAGSLEQTIQQEPILPPEAHAGSLAPPSPATGPTAGAPAGMSQPPVGVSEPPGGPGSHVGVAHAPGGVADTAVGPGGMPVGPLVGPGAAVAVPGGTSAAGRAAPARPASSPFMTDHAVSI